MILLPISQDDLCAKFWHNLKIVNIPQTTEILSSLEILDSVWEARNMELNQIAYEKFNKYPALELKQGPGIMIQHWQVSSFLA